MMLLVVGGGAAAFLLLAVGGAVVWWLASRGEPVAPGKAAQATPVKNIDNVAEQKPQNYAIKLFVPARKGARREVKVVEDLKAEAGVAGNFDVPPKVQAALSESGLDAKVTMKGVVKTLEVDGDGKESEIELTILQGDVVQIGTNNPVLPTGPLPCRRVLC